MRINTNRAEHPFERRLDEILSAAPQNEEIINEDGRRTIRMHLPHYDSDEAPDSLGEAISWLESEANAGNIMPLRKEKMEDGGLMLMAAHPRRNANIIVELTPDMKYRRMKLF